MRFVIDTNVIVSAILWGGTPRKVVEACLQYHSVFMTSDMLAELDTVLSYQKFATTLEKNGIEKNKIILDILKTIHLIEPAEIESVIQADPDDDMFIACAIAAKAKYIISGDKHLLKIKNYEDIEIITVQKIHNILYS